MLQHLDLLGVILAAASLVLHYVAPKTKTKADDKVKEAVDFAKDKILPGAKALAPKPSAPEAPKAVTGFQAEGGVRDHRK